MWKRMVEWSFCLLVFFCLSGEATTKRFVQPKMAFTDFVNQVLLPALNEKQFSAVSALVDPSYRNLPYASFAINSIEQGQSKRDEYDASDFQGFWLDSFALASSPFTVKQYLGGTGVSLSFQYEKEEELEKSAQANFYIINSTNSGYGFAIGSCYVTLYPQSF